MTKRHALLLRLIPAVLMATPVLAHDIPADKSGAADPTPNVSDHQSDRHVDAAPDSAMGEAYLGVVAEAIRGKRTKPGVIVRSVMINGPAYNAGIEIMSIITAVDGVEVFSPLDLNTTIRKHEPGDKVVISLRKSGKTFDVDATLGKIPDMAARRAEVLKKVDQLNVSEEMRERIRSNIEGRVQWMKELPVERGLALELNPKAFLFLDLDKEERQELLQEMMDKGIIVPVKFRNNVSLKLQKQLAAGRAESGDFGEMRVLTDRGDVEPEENDREFNSLLETLEEELAETHNPEQIRELAGKLSNHMDKSKNHQTWMFADRVYPGE